MASGNGLSEGDVRISNFVTTDLIAAVRMEEVILFVSLRETLEGNTSLSKSYFVYPKKVKSGMNNKTINLLNSNNPLVGVSGLLDKKIVFKKSREQFFGLTYVPDVVNKKIELSSNQPITAKMELLNKSGFSDSSINTMNTNMNKLNIYLIRVIQEGSTNKDVYTRTTGLLHFTDFKNFLEKSKITTKLEDKLYFKNNDLPRIATAKFMRSFAELKGNLSSAYGTICWNLDNKLDLFPNIEYDAGKKITKVNYADFEDVFVNKDLCSPDRFKQGDQILGYVEDGVFDKITPEVLDKEETSQKVYYQENIKKINKGKITSYLKIKYRKFFKYPKPTISVFITRENPSLPFFDNMIQTNGANYSVAFYETLNPRKTTNFEFDAVLKKELVDFIMRRYVSRNRLTIRNEKKNNEVRKILIEMEKDYKYGGPRINVFRKFYVSRDDIIFMIEALTGIKETTEKTVDSQGKTIRIESESSKIGEGTAIKTFLKDPNIFYGTSDGTQYPNLRYISYFVLCAENEICNQVKNVVPDTPLESMDILKNVPGSSQSYKMYYNSQDNTFTNKAVY